MDKIKPYTLLVVDDVPANLQLLRAILEPHYLLKVALSGQAALNIANAAPQPDLVLLDVMMPGMDGFEVCRRLKATPACAAIPVLFVTSKDEQLDEEEGFAAGAVDYITRPVSAPLVLARVRAQLALYDQARELERQVRLRTAELEETRLQIIHRLCRAAEFKDNETGYHVLRMAHYARLLAHNAGLAPDTVARIFQAAPMHDIGKIGIPDSVLLKPGKLDAAEWDIMRGHAAMGADIIGEQGDPLLALAREVALTHHEKWDGSGYPAGLRGEAIPIAGRIVAMADVFDALTSTRPYKPAWPLPKVLDFFAEQSGCHFDPGLAPALQASLPEMLVIMRRFAETEPA